MNIQGEDNVQHVLYGIRKPPTERAYHVKSVRNMKSASAERPRTFRERPRNNYVAKKMMGRSIGRSLTLLAADCPGLPRGLRG